MSELTDGYSKAKSAVEDWIHVIQNAEEAAVDPIIKLNYGMMVSQLEMVAKSLTAMSKTAEELEETLLAMGLKPRSVDTTSLDALWGDDEQAT